MIVGLSDTCHLFHSLILKPVVIVSFVIHDWSDDEILCERRRLRLPLETRCLPWIAARNLAVLQRPDKVDDGQQVTYTQNRGARSREHVQDLKLRRVGRIAPRHAQRAQNKLGKEREVKPDKCYT